MSKRKSSAIPLRVRYLAIILGMVFFLWIPFEDTSAAPAILLAAAISFWLASLFLALFQPPFQNTLFNFVLIGTAAGMAVTPLALGLMALKTGLHGHSAPDFTSQQIISVIRRTPLWMIGGFLIGQWLVNPPRIVDPEVSAGSFRQWFWENRGLDLAVQVGLIFGGALGIATLLPRSKEDEGE